MKTFATLAVGNLHIDLELALEFLVVFSRFEYALKERLYVHQGADERPLKVDYIRFAGDISDAYENAVTSDAKLKHAVDYFCKSPPRAQIWDGKRPQWAPEEKKIKPTSKNILTLVFRVRNNLFHGGKGWLKPEGNAERDRHLMTHALTIVEAILALDAQLESAFSSFQ